MTTAPATFVADHLKPACRAAGGQAAWAAAHGMSPAYVSDVVRGNRAPGDKILDALGLERVVTYRRKTR